MKAGADIIEHGIYTSIQTNPDVEDLIFLLRNFDKSYYPHPFSHLPLQGS
jgi:hypothetical protein